MHEVASTPKGKVYACWSFWIGQDASGTWRLSRLSPENSIKTDVIDANVLARLYASGFLPEVWGRD